MKTKNTKLLGEELAKLMEEYTRKLAVLKPGDKEYIDLLNEFHSKVYPEKTEKEQGFIDLMEKFFEDLAKDQSPDSVKYVNDFGKIILTLSNEELEAAWPELQLQKATNFSEADDDEKEILKLLDQNLKKRMYVVSRGKKRYGQVSWKVRYQVITGDFPYFEGNGEILPEVSGTTGGGGRSSSQQSKPAGQELSQKVESRIIATLEKFERDFDNLPKTVSDRVELVVKLVAKPLNGVWKFLIGLTCAASLFTAYFSYTSMRVPEKVESIEGKVKIVQDSLTFGFPKIKRLVNTSREEIHALQDSVNKLMPKSKAKK